MANVAVAIVTATTSIVIVWLRGFHTSARTSHGSASVPTRRRNAQARQGRSALAAYVGASSTPQSTAHRDYHAGAFLGA